MTQLQCEMQQPFGGNYVETYKKGGLLGHTGIDEKCGYGSDVLAYWPMKVYKVLTKDRPAFDGSGYTAVFGIVDDGIELYEIQYGHCDPIAKEGDSVSRGQLVATEANHGEVYAGTERITLEMQKAGDRRGNHRHVQKRLVTKAKRTSPGKQYLTVYNEERTGAQFYRDAEGFYYEIRSYGNGYNGCVDFLLPLFNRDLFFGRSGYDVLCLQSFLKREGFFEGGTTEFFGPKTMAAAAAFQEANGINPSLGYVGPKTRKLINSLI